MLNARLLFVVLTVGVTFVFIVPAMGDWDEGDDAAFVLLPDLDPTGVDVHLNPPISSQFGVWIADDFSVSSDMPMTDIHLWGSWYDDIYPANGGSDVEFYLAIWDDIPAGIDGKNYSRPGNKLWEIPANGIDTDYGIAADEVRVYADNLQEGYYVPRYPRSNSTYYPVGDTVCWQYNFYFDPEQAFELEANKVYWLQVAAYPGDPWAGQPEAYFGWKSSYQHYNDCAVLADWNVQPQPITPDWQMLKYPSGHQLANGEMDLAFVITPEPATVCLIAIGGLLVRRRK